MMIPIYLHALIVYDYTTNWKQNRFIRNEATLMNVMRIRKLIPVQVTLHWQSIAHHRIVNWADGIRRSLKWALAFNKDSSRSDIYCWKLRKHKMNLNWAGQIIGRWVVYNR